MSYKISILTPVHISSGNKNACFSYHPDKNDHFNYYKIEDLLQFIPSQKLLDLKLNNINHDTISGFVIHLLGEIPSDNQERTVTYKNLTFKITGVKNNRITKIKLLIDKKVPEANQDD